MNNKYEAVTFKLLLVSLIKNDLVQKPKPFKNGLHKLEHDLLLNKSKFTLTCHNFLIYLTLTNYSRQIQNAVKLKVTTEINIYLPIPVAPRMFSL